jgi:hypothetical protein
MAKLIYDWLQVHAVREICAAGGVEQMAELAEAAIGNAHITPTLMSGNLNDDRAVFPRYGR